MIRRRFKYFMPERNEYSKTGEETLLSVSEYYGVKPRSEAFDAEGAESRAESLEGYRKVRTGDFVMNYMLAWKGAYGVSEYDGIVSPAYAVYRIDPRYADRRFIHHRLRSEHMRSVFRARSKGIIESRLRLYPDAFLSMEIYLPDLESQKTIADFLDRETARIDQLIENKLRLVEISKNHWERFVFDIFSGATETDQKTRILGYDFLPSVPSHWTLPRLKHLSPQVTVGIVVTPAAYYVDDGIPAVRAANIRPMSIRKDDMVFISNDGHRINSKSKIKAGDVLAVRTGQPGTATVVPQDLDGANCIDLILIRKSKKYLSELLAFFLNSNSAKAQYLLGSSGAIQQHFNIATAGNLIVPTPPLEEQKLILQSLHKERERLSRLTEATDKSLDRLSELRSALITAAVTGQINVETWHRRGVTDRRLDKIEKEMATPRATGQVEARA